MVSSLLSNCLNVADLRHYVNELYSWLYIQRHTGWLLVGVLHKAKYKVISGQVSTYGSVHLWQLYKGGPLENQVTGTMTCYPTQSHYPDTELTSPCPILIMPRARLENDKYQFDKSLIWLDRELNSPSPTCEACALQIQPPYLVASNSLQTAVNFTPIRYSCTSTVYVMFPCHTQTRLLNNWVSWSYANATSPTIN